jgi:nucleoside-diphosphate-sugar epimerase
VTVRKKYLVTGGTGFIGASLVRRLVSRGDTVRILDNNSRGAVRRLGNLVSSVELVVADIRDGEQVTRAAEGMNSVLHLAYVNGTEFFYSQPELVLDIAIRGMLNVIDACRKNDVRELVFASSSEVYQTPPRIPTAEDAPLSVPDVLNLRYSYGGSKIACELMAVAYGRLGFDRVMIFRPHNVYGPDMGWEHVLPQFVLRAGRQIIDHPRGPVPFRIQGDGSQTRAFVHIDDFTDGIICILDRGEHMQIYHVGNPEEVTILDVVQRLFTYLGREPRVITDAMPAGGPVRRCPDIGRVRTIGYEPRISLAEGLPSLIEWYMANAHLNPTA